MHVVFMYMYTCVPAREIGIENESRKGDTDALGPQVGIVNGKGGQVGQRSRDEGNW